MDEREQMAAELALGVLGAAARAEALARAEADPAFAALVERWEARLAPLAVTLAPDIPPAGVLDRVEARIGAENAELGGTVTVRKDRRQWQRMMDGIDVSVVWQNLAAGRQQILLRVQPGAVYDGHHHDDDEELLVLEGECAFGELELKAGDFHYAPKGYHHPPATTRVGCLLLITTGLDH